jgi:hypothetical protein
VFVAGLPGGKKQEMTHSPYAAVLTSLMAFTITNLMDAMARIETMAHSDTATMADIATAAGNAIEAAKALTTGD